MANRRMAALVAVAVLGSLSACKSSNNSSGNVEISGAGSTFVNPVMTRWTADFTKLHPNVLINYQSIGSGGGIQQVKAKTVDFGASDVALKDDQLATMQPLVQIPETAGPVCITYNLPGLDQPLKLSPDALAGIFLGTIKSWQDPKLTKENPGVKLPKLPVIVSHRSDGSGTTGIFTDYLDKVSPDWHTKVGKGSSVNWPVGLGGKGNPGVAGTIKQTPGAIGYIELAYAIQNGMSYAEVQNKSGNFIIPTVASTSAAGNVQLPPDSKVSLTNTDAADGYPISGFTWALIYKEQNYNNRSLDRATKLLKLLWWNVHDGQQYTAALNYASLAPAAVTVAENILKSATYDGKPILQ